MYKKSWFIKFFKSSIFVVGSIYSSQGLAHDFDGNLAAPASSGGADVFAISCFNEADNAQGATHHLYISIRNNVKSDDVLSLIAAKNTGKGWLAKSTHDLTGGDYASSPAAIIAGGDGEYLAFVQHSAETPVSYQLQFHCQDAQNQHTGTDIQIIQNE